MKIAVKILLFNTLLILNCNFSFSQFIKMDDRVIVAGYVLDIEDDKPLPYANISIRHRREGTISDTSGYFALSAKMYDTIRFSMLGYERKFIVIDDKAIDRNEPLIVKLKTEAYLLPTVNIFEWRYNQLKYEVTTMNLPDDDYTFANQNFPVKQKAIDFYNRPQTEGAGFVFSPITALYEAFSKEGKERKKLAELQEKDHISALIEERITTEQLMELTGFSKLEAERFLDWCGFTADFINSMNAYYFILVVKHKAEQYKKLNKNDKSGKIYLE
ncbi:MAG: carboxypeptidase-like regulatory domain-containing protein [Bacteroidales bacterium]|nr:carboxypeptidase-like regulatory domain-containing protein [Bacteroidales bacterium]